MPQAAKTKEEEWCKYLRWLNCWILWWQGMIPEGTVIHLVQQLLQTYPNPSAAITFGFPAPLPLLQPSWHNQIVDTGPNNKLVLPTAPPAVPAASLHHPCSQPKQATIIDLTNTTILEFSNDKPAPIEPAGGPAGLDSSGGTSVVLENHAETDHPTVLMLNQRSCVILTTAI
ncbi:hypothetical protein RHS01_09383 [Rhizoctonia solani]|uniref:Uncharacterized protein n=1 Tax=Rhizoctonia solani TaxID=456999 RepID=A0A8H7I798_9AGAM|nr:hypothetical protein RHS01_09383 [Rhizoctonia solani]